MASTNAGPKFLHLADVIPPRALFLRKWEKKRHTKAHWLVQMIAESVGVFMFVYAGICASIQPRLNAISGQAYGESGFYIALSFGMGITFAIAIIGSASGGHINPAVTIAFVLFKGFPPLKAVGYIAAQIFGAYIACLLAYGQYYDLIKAAEGTLIAAGTYNSINYTPSGLAGIFAVYTSGSNLGSVFLNEFVADFWIALIIWGALDPTNFFVPPAFGPWIIGLGFVVIINACSPVGLATNAARDIGARLAVITIWGTQATGGTKYPAITALSSILATVLATGFYEFMFKDSSRVIVPSHRESIEGHKAHADHRSDIDRGYDVENSRYNNKEVNKFHA